MKQTKPAQAMELRSLSPVFARLRRSQHNGPSLAQSTLPARDATEPVGSRLGSLGCCGTAPADLASVVAGAAPRCGLPSWTGSSSMSFGDAK